MIVENIDYSDKYNNVIITISGEDFYISYDLYNDLSIQNEDELDFDTYKVILADDEFNRAKNYALSKLSFAAKSSFEVEKLLKQKDFSKEAIDKTIDFLDEYGLIDDEAYVRSFVADKHNISKWSKNKIRYNLNTKNIKDDLIDTYLSQIPYDEEYEKALAFAQKKARDDFSVENKQKVYRHLASKAFDFDIINKVVGELFK